jgi:hypothetical protein
VPTWWPKSDLDLIPDAETALKVGKIILERYYGDDLVRKYEPYRVRASFLDENEWVVSGSNPRNDGGLGGGFPELLIARKDGRVRSVSRSK